MGRPGEFYDQDADEPAPSAPRRRGRPALYDQDSPSPPPFAAGKTPPLVITSRPVPLSAPGPFGAPPDPPSPPLATRPRPGPQPPSTGRATAILAGGTFASRLTGFLRVLAIGYVLGVSSLSDAFNYANGIPNIVYDLLLGGILSATLIPVFVEQLAGDDRDESVSAVLTAIGAALVAASALLWLVAPWVIRFYLLLNSSSTAPPERALATTLLRWFSPQVFFLGATVASTALLNARRRFAAAAVSPVVNNLIAIAALIATKVVADRILASKATPASLISSFARDEKAVIVLGAGTTVGYAAQLLVQLPSMRHLGVRVRACWNPGHPAVRRVANLSSWLIGVVITNQASLALVMVLAGRVNGGVTAYQFAYQFFQLPYALIAVSVASAIMPDLAERWTAGDRTGFERQFVIGLRTTLALVVPVALVYMAVAQPFIQLAIHHGRVTQSGAHLVSASLVLFAAGLPGFSAYFLLMRAFQAMQDARGMFWVYAVENGLTVVAALILEPLLGIPGLALAWVGPYTVTAVYAAVRLRPAAGALGGWLTIRSLIRVVIASAFAGAAAVAVGRPFPSRAGDAILLARLAAQVGAAGAVYAYAAHALGIREFRPMLRAVRRIAGG